MANGGRTVKVNSTHRHATHTQAVIWEGIASVSRVQNREMVTMALLIKINVLWRIISNFELFGTKQHFYRYCSVIWVFKSHNQMWRIFIHSFSRERIAIFTEIIYSIKTKTCFKSVKIYPTCSIAAYNFLAVVYSSLSNRVYVCVWWTNFLFWQELVYSVDKLIW